MPPRLVQRKPSTLQSMSRSMPVSRQRATLGESSDRLRKVWGEHER